MSHHYHYGAGPFGGPYQDGPHWADTYQEAVDNLTDSYNLGRQQHRALKQNGYLELDLGPDGNGYCEIVACTEED